jgi:hypothetical protein
MKKISFMLAGLCMVFLISCSKGTDGELTPLIIVKEEQLLGKWKLEKVVEQYYEAGNPDPDTDTWPGQPGDSIVFKNHGLMYVYEPGFPDDPEALAYELKGWNKLVIDDLDFTIREITESKLRLYSEDKDDGDKWTEEIYLYR